MPFCVLLGSLSLMPWMPCQCLFSTPRPRPSSFVLCANQISICARAKCLWDFELLLLLLNGRNPCPCGSNCLDTLAGLAGLGLWDLRVRPIRHILGFIQPIVWLCFVLFGLVWCNVTWWLHQKRIKNKAEPKENKQKTKKKEKGRESWILDRKLVFFVSERDKPVGIVIAYIVFLIVPGVSFLLLILGAQVNSSFKF